VALVIASATLAGACSGSAPSPWTGTIAEVTLLCGLQQASPAGCTAACLVDAYFDAIEGVCAPEAAALDVHAEYDAYLDCASACPISRICMEAPIDLSDCDCLSTCAMAQTMDFQTLWIARQRCVFETTESVCRP
jgi:hypothetical protein